MAIPQETLNLDTQDRDLDPLGEQFSFDLSDNAAKIWIPFLSMDQQLGSRCKASSLQLQSDMYTYRW